MAPTGVTLQHVVKKLNSFAPRKLAETWDNIGLLIEPATPQTITLILLTNDLTEAVMQEALDLSVSMIISYHPPIFTPLKSVSSRSWKERIVAKCLENRIALYSPHTTFDAVEGGVNDWLASAFETVCLRPIIQTYELSCCLLEVTVPKSADANAVIAELRSEIAKVCAIKGDESFVTNIVKTFDENMIIQITCTHELLSKYEECYYNCFAENKNYKLKTTKYEKSPLSGTGMGRLIRLKDPMPVSQVVDRMKKHLNIPHLRLAVAVDKDMGSKVSTIALCAGSGYSVLKKARADLFVTGEMLHHDILETVHQGSHVILTNHSDSERGYLVLFADILANQLLGGKVNVVVSKADRDPIVTV